MYGNYSSQTWTQQNPAACLIHTEYDWLARWLLVVGAKLKVRTVPDKDVKYWRHPEGGLEKQIYQVIKLSKNDNTYWLRSKESVRSWYPTFSQSMLHWMKRSMMQCLCTKPQNRGKLGKPNVVLVCSVCNFVTMLATVCATYCWMSGYWRSLKNCIS